MKTSITLAKGMQFLFGKNRIQRARKRIDPTPEHIQEFIKQAAIIKRERKRLKRIRDNRRQQYHYYFVENNYE